MHSGRQRLIKNIPRISLNKAPWAGNSRNSFESFKYITKNTNNTMTEATISVRVEKSVHDQMQLHDEINWSGVLRTAIDKKLDELETIDTKQAREAIAETAKLRKAKSFAGKKLAEEIIREWRDKRK